MKKNTLFYYLLACLIFCSLSSRAQWNVTSASCVDTVWSLAAKGNTIFAGTYGYGMFRSTDNGTTWSAANNGLTFPSIDAIAISGNKIFAGTWGGGAYFSIDSGNSWTQINGGLTASDISGFAINGSYIVAATGDEGAFLSKDNGINWTPVDSGLTSYGYMISIVQSGTNIFIGDYFGGVFLSVDSGKSWNATGIGADEIYSFATIGSNVFGGTYANGGGIFLTKDKGASWASADSGLTSKGVRSLAVSGSNILAGTDSTGVFLSVNNGSVWTAFNTGGLNGNRIFSLAVNSSYIFAGTKDGHIWRRAIGDIISCTPVITSADNSICQGSAVTLSASTGSNYLWTTGETTQSIVATTAGVYSCAITTNCGVLTSNAINLTIRPLPVAAITSSGPTTFCKGGNDTLEASSGTAYLWSNGKTTSSITVVNSNTYSVIILGANGCTATASVNIVSVPLLVITSQPANDTVFAGCMAAQFTVGDTAPNLTFQWQVDAGSGFGNLSNAGFYNGVNTDTLTISNTVAVMNGYNYRCILSNSACDTASSSARLTVKTAKIASQTDTLCAGDSLTVGIHTYNASGTYLDTLKSIIACDSIYLTTHLVIDSTIRHSQTIALCAGGNFSVGVHTYNTAGTYIDSIQNGKGCDSIVTTHLTIQTIKDSLVITLCAGDSLTVGSHTYKTSGINRDTLTTLSGCDSIVVTNLVIDSIIKHSQTVTLCAGHSIIVGGIFIHNTTGVFVDSLQNGKGCDSIVTTHLIITPAVRDSITIALCAGDSLMLGSHIYKTSGSYTDSLFTGGGCDSLVIVKLAIDSIIKYSQTITRCAGQSFTVGIHTYDTTGVYIDSLQNGKGCDSIVTTTLTVSPIAISKTYTLCAGDSVTVGAHTYTTSGIYIDSLTTGAGCDSIITTHLAYFSDIVLKGDTLTITTTSPAIYQWFNCANRDSILAITKSFTPGVEGDYAAIVTVNGCSDTSACVTISNVGIKVNNTLNYFITLYPNPATNTLNIRTSSTRTNEAAVIAVMNVMGEIMQTKKLKWSSEVSIDINNLPAGMYFLQMNSESRSVTKRFIKE